MRKDNVFEMPVPIGGTVYETDFPKYPCMVMGYRIGKMCGEDEEDCEGEGWYIQYGNGVLESSYPISEIGVSIFLTQKDAEQASKLN